MNNSSFNISLNGSEDLWEMLMFQLGSTCSLDSLYLFLNTSISFFRNRIKRIQLIRVVPNQRGPSILQVFEVLGLEWNTDLCSIIHIFVLAIAEIFELRVQFWIRSDPLLYSQQSLIGGSIRKFNEHIHLVRTNFLFPTFLAASLQRKSLFARIDRISHQCSVEFTGVFLERNEK